LGRGYRLILLAIVVASFASACSSRRFVHVWDERYVEAARAHDRGEYEEAEAHYEQLLKHAPNDETRRLALYQIAMLAEDRGDLDGAIERYEAIWSEDVRDEHGARAASRVVVIEDERGANERADELRAMIIARFPEHIPAERALRELGRAARASGEQVAFAAYLEEVIAASAGTDLEDYAMLMLGRLRYGELGDVEGAVAVLEALVELDAEAKLADDAIWEIATIYRETEQWEPAVEQLRRLVGNYQGESYFIGDYNSEWADDARFDSAEILASELGRGDEAISEFELFLKEFPDSRRRDDAAWRIVEIRRELANQRRYKRALERFVRDFPESRYAEQARAELDAVEGS